MPKIPQLEANVEFPRRYTSPSAMGVADEAAIKAGQHIEALGEYGTKVYGAIQEKERLAKDTLDGMAYENNIIDERNRILKDLATDQNYEGYENKLKNELEGIRQKLEPNDPSTRLKLATEKTFNHYANQLLDAVTKRKYTMMEHAGKVEAIRLADTAAEEYSNAYDDAERKLVKDKFELKMDTLRESYLVDPLWVEEHKLSWEGKAKQIAINLADVEADKFIEADPKKASVELRDSKVIPNLLPKQRRDKVEKAIAASKIVDADFEKKNKELEISLEKYEDQNIANLFMEGKYKEAYVAAYRSLRLDGTKKRVWTNAIEEKVKAKDPEVDDPATYFNFIQQVIDPTLTDEKKRTVARNIIINGNLKDNTKKGLLKDLTEDKLFNDPWFKRTESEVKEALGWTQQMGFLGLGKENALQAQSSYRDITNRLIMEIKRDGLKGEDIYKRGRQLMLPEQMKFWDLLMGGKGEKEKEKPKKVYEIGKVYTDADGNKAKYLGNGKWEKR